MFETAKNIARSKKFDEECGIIGTAVTFARNRVAHTHTYKGPNSDTRKARSNRSKILWNRAMKAIFKNIQTSKSVSYTHLTLPTNREV